MLVKIPSTDKRQDYGANPLRLDYSTTWKLKIWGWKRACEGNYRHASDGGQLPQVSMRARTGVGFAGQVVASTGVNGGWGGLS